jgi:hypothetical protein
VILDIAITQIEKACAATQKIEQKFKNTSRFYLTTAGVFFRKKTV